MTTYRDVHNVFYENIHAMFSQDVKSAGLWRSNQSFEQTKTKFIEKEIQVKNLVMFRLHTFEERCKNTKFDLFLWYEISKTKHGGN